MSWRVAGTLLPGLLAAVATSAGAAGVDCSTFRFHEAGAAAGLAFRHDAGGRGELHLPEISGSGLAWIDYDGDGWLDLYLVQSGPFPPDGSPGAANRLFRNLGDGTFADVSERAAAGDRGYGMGALAADLDGDGDEDLLLTNFGPLVLLRNRGDGSFEDATRVAGLRLDGWSSSAAAADADGDGDLDLYVARYAVYDPATPLFCGDPSLGQRDYCHPALFAGQGDRYFRNRGDGTFEDASGAAGLPVVDGRGLGVVFTDLDGDRAPDVYVANDLNLNNLYRNQGDGTFEDVALLAGAAVSRDGVPEAGMGVAAADIDGDGRLDLMVTNFDVEVNSLFRNLGEMMFEDRSLESGFGPPSYNLLGFGIVAADFDRDLAVDVFVTNGHVQLRPKADTAALEQRDLLLMGDGRGQLSERRCAVPELHHVGRGLASADYDHDGDLDLAIQSNSRPARLLRNELAAGGGWLGVLLRGSRGNTAAVGARITLTTEGTTQRGWVLAGGSYASTSDRRQLFAAPPQGGALAVEWPDGRRQRLQSPATGRYLVLAAP